jgi:hypothetical protein
MFMEALFTAVKLRQQHGCSIIEEWIKKMWNDKSTMYTSLKFQGKPSSCIINIHLIFKKLRGRRRKYSFSRGGYQW